MLRNFPLALSRLLLLCACFAFATFPARAQSQATSGNIEGRVLDPNGAVVPNATVGATNKETGLERTATSDDDGNYRIILLPPGLYTVRASGVSGFQPATLDNVRVSVGGKTTLDINLSISGGETIIDVTSEAPVVETTRTSVSSVVNERAIENLPVNGRNYLDFATLTPGVVRDPSRQGDLSVGGQKGTLNNLQVDGADNNNTFFGQAFGRTGVRPPYQFSEESVKEFQVNQNGFSAEFGRAGGAVINVVTKSGTNSFHGGLFEYFRDESLNANLPNVIASLTPTGQPRPNKRPPSQINQYGGRIGGPIVKNKAFFFFTYDGQRTNFLNVLEVPAIPAALQSFFVPKLNPYQVDRDQDVYMAKVDWAIDNSNQLSVRFNRQNFTGVNNEFTGAQAAEEHSGNSLAKTTTVAGILTSTFSSSIVNEFRFQAARDSEPGTNNSNSPELQIRSAFGTLSFGRNNFSPRETTITRSQVVNNLSYVHGAHNTKVGVDLVFDNTLNFFPGSFGGIYVYNAITDFPNNPATFTQRFGGAGLGATTKPNTKDYAAFIQDDWRVTQHLTVNAGVRYDYQRLAAPPIQNTDPVLLAAGLDTARQPKDRDNFSPRIGFSYAPDDKSVVRGGYGLFYGRTTGIMLGTAHSGNGIQTTGITLNGASAIAAAGLIYPNVLPGLPPGANTGRSDLFIFSEDYQQPYVQQARLGYERELFRDTSVSATYMFFKGVHLSRTRDINLFDPVPTTATFNGQSFTVLRFPGTGANADARFTSTTPLRPFANYNRISLFEDTGNSRYHGLALQANRRFSRNFQFLAAYTYSVAKDDRPDQTAVVPGGGDDAKIVENQKNIRADFSYADSDLRHRFVLSPVYEFGHYTSDNAFARAFLSNWTLSGIVQAQSGFAYTQTVAADLNRDGNARNDRVPGTCRNCFRTPSTYQFDARITRSIPFGETTRLRLILEGFNIFNRANVAVTNTNLFRGFTATSTGGVGTFTLLPVLPNAPFGAPRLFLNARELQLAVKFDF
ncbi:MAG TPA: TonB-dependent receptor [Pyrinomonadaceae bacterium]|jgi:outer membrane receptor protein involved in Fe transport|nr:TonB-dependent receptor [Pyrinomonadaceae bacterium]